MRKGILIHYVKKKVWFLCPILILNKTKKFIIFRICENTTVLRATDQNGKIIRMDSEYWKLTKMKWKDHNLTYLVPYDEFIGFGILRDRNNSFKEYYLNFQTKVKIYNDIVTMTDLEIDFVINDFYRKISYWKDVDEFKRLVNKNIISNNIIEEMIFDENILYEKLLKYKSILDKYSLLYCDTPKV